jgi:hypothetical protein
MMADAMHPNTKGHRIIGSGLVAFALRSTLQQELSHIAADAPPAAAAGAAAQLPEAVSPLAAREADGDTFCADGRGLDGFVLQSSVQENGWQWTDSAPGTAMDVDACRTARAARGYKVNCGNWGLSTRGVGKHLEFVINTKILPNSDGVSRRSTAVSSGQLDRRRLVLFYDRGVSKGFRVGNSREPPTARVQCVRGCSCGDLLLGGDSLTWSELMASGSTEVGGGKPKHSNLLHQACVSTELYS